MKCQCGKSKADFVSNGQYWHLRCMPYEVKIQYPNLSQMDAEVLELCNALNTLPGVKTFDSCCGHGKRPFKIGFFPADFEAVALVAYWADACHSQAEGWRVHAFTDCVRSSHHFNLVGPIGDYDGAAKIAQAIRQQDEAHQFKRWKCLP